MPRRVAITIAGAVSLGAYEAGVTYELFEAFRRHNEVAKVRAPDDMIFVDVITGASAGGMTAAMLAECLMFRGADMTGPATNPLYDAWVKRITLEGLVKLGDNERKWNSLFSSDLITRIGTEMLVDSMSTPPTGSHICLEPGAPLRIGLALTNLNGVNYEIPIEGIKEGGFIYTTSVDQRHFVVYPGRTLGLDLLTPEKVLPAHWTDLRSAAVACGAFPFAFRPQQIQRNKLEFINKVTPPFPTPPEKPKPGTTYVVADPKQPWNFSYTDGGVLQNQPLGIAKDLVDARVNERLTTAHQRKQHAEEINDSAEALAATEHIGNIQRDADCRIYVFVSPNQVTGSERLLDAATIDLEQMLPDIVSVYLRQATFHDWIMAENVNRDIRLLDKRAEDLADCLGAGGIKNPTAFFDSADNLNDLMLGRDGKTQVYDRLRHQYKELIKRKLADPLLVEAFVAGVAALEAAAQLGNRDKMHIIAVLADGKRELAGSGISSFVGFFSEAYREHDYRVGRQKAREYLCRDDVSGLLALDTKVLNNFYDANPIAPMDPPVQVPVKLHTALAAGRKWLLYALWIRIRVIALTLLILIVIVVILLVLL